EGVRVEYMNWFYTQGVEYSPRLDIELSSAPHPLVHQRTLLAALALAIALAVAASQIRIARRAKVGEDFNTRKEQ
ncbi:MAG: hypothetical protein QW390_01340, partial [Candidatus Bathyarchaeia archaeon]